MSAPLIPRRDTNGSTVPAAPLPRRRSQLLTIVVTAVVAAIATQAVAAIGAIPSDGRFTACYQTSASVLDRIVLLAEPGEQCPPTYARVTWPAQASGGQAGPAGPAGPPGPAGPQGPAGPAGASRLGSVRVVSRTLQLREQVKPAVVRCHYRETAIGGGYKVRYFAPALELPLASYPWVVKGRPVGWAFAPMRAIKVSGVFSLDGLETAPAGVRVSNASRPEHRHRLGYPGTRVAIPGADEPLGAFPFTVDVYAMCVRR